MDDDKSFACPFSDCGLKFQCEEELCTHKKKHDLSLSLTPTSAFRTSLFDQTPTPTRFLNALETEIFQELQSNNPFDATFERANSLVARTGQIAIPESTSLFSSLPDTEPLNTPSITLTSENEVLPVTRQENSVIFLKKPSKRKESISRSSDETSQTLPFSPDNRLSSKESVSEENSNNVSTCEQEREAEKNWPSVLQDDLVSSASRKLSSDTSAEHRNHNTVVQTPVITSVGNLAKTSATCVPTAVVVTRTIPSDVPSLSSSVSQMSVVAEPVKSLDYEQPVLQPVSAAPVLQLIIRLPDGQSMPVKIPMTIPAISSAAITVPPANSIYTTVSTKATTTQSVAKIKLKEVLTLPHRNARSNRSANDLSTRKLSVRNAVKISPPQTIFDNSLSESPPSSPHTVNGTVSSGRRHREILEDPEVKRRKSLERNRAAATRCRQKRKHWIQTLEKKADEMAATNVHLQNEVTMLRKEVAQLKTMLLAHKDCPVTQQQKASGYHEVIVNPTRFIPVSCLSSTTTNTSSISVPAIVELMDAETSSSQSSSGVSLEVNYVVTSGKE